MVDGVSIVTFDLVSSGTPARSPSTANVSVFDVARFDAYQHQAAQSTPALGSSQPIKQVELSTRVNATEPTQGFRTALQFLQSLNGNSESLSVEALRFSAERKTMTPGEMLNLTMHAHHFLFQSELTANVANKTSDGIQQLFRQQS